MEIIIPISRSLAMMGMFILDKCSYKFRRCGEDNYEYGWLKRNPQFHDIPCKDITLKGKKFKTEIFTTEVKGDKAETGAYSSFGKTTTFNQAIRGCIPCTGAILKVPIDGENAEMVAWGLRNPYGLALSPDGKLYAIENSYDVRGSRSVFGTGDVLWHIEQGIWYGWPDYE